MKHCANGTMRLIAQQKQAEAACRSTLAEIKQLSQWGQPAFHSQLHWLVDSSQCCVFICLAVWSIGPFVLDSPLLLPYWSVDPSPIPDTDTARRTLGDRYRGSGVSGYVYCARLRTLPDLEVAVKVLKADPGAHTSVPAAASVQVRYQNLIEAATVLRCFGDDAHIVRVFGVCDYR